MSFILSPFPAIIAPPWCATFRVDQGETFGDKTAQNLTMTWHNTKEIGWYTIMEIGWYTFEEIHWYTMVEIRQCEKEEVHLGVPYLYEDDSVQILNFPTK